MKISYATLLFGGIIEVKRLFAQELAEHVASKGLSPEEFDSILRLIHPQSAEYPRTREIIDDPSLFTDSYNQMLGWASLSCDNDEKDIIGQLSGRLMEKKIREHLAVPRNLEEVLADFHSVGYVAHVSVEHPEVQIEKVLTGESLRVGSPNHISPLNLACIHIGCSIEREVGDEVSPT